MTAYFRERFCSIDLPSEFVFFVTETFLMGVTVFVDNGQVKYQGFDEQCKPFGEISLYTDVLRLTSVTHDVQAINCENATYLLDIVSPPVIQTSKGTMTESPSFAPKIPTTLSKKW